MSGHVAGLLTDDRQVIRALDLEHLVAGPLTVLPGPDLTGEFAEVDLGIEVGREIVPVATGVDIDDVDIADAVEILIHGDSRVSIDHARVEADKIGRASCRESGEA